ncbi:MAG: heavy metal-responsive transcriptional regulator [Acidimicrobiia bacterium]|nr:heavy metal-responsive transcriptional regulator [Acidimicrobiia bacterium]
MRIGELANRVGLTTKTIRYYESIGLLDDPPRTTSGYREYDAAVADRLRFVREAQATGLSLAEIGSILEIKSDGGQSCSHTRALLERHLREVDEQIVRLEQARAELAVLADRAAELDPSTCVDPNRCQVITDRDNR